MKTVIIDGQGGRIGKMLIEQLKEKSADCELIAIGTNSIATSAMLKAGADIGATGENPVVVAASDADIIAGPIGILIADSLLGEITERMSAAVGKSKAHKILIPASRCNVEIAVPELPLGEYIKYAAEKILAAIAAGKNN